MHSQARQPFGQALTAVNYVCENPAARTPAVCTSTLPPVSLPPECTKVSHNAPLFISNVTERTTASNTAWLCLVKLYRL
jgi:hypothetical protein